MEEDRSRLERERKRGGRERERERERRYREVSEQDMYVIEYMINMNIKVTSSE